MSLIKTNFLLPTNTDPVKQAQRLAQDLSANFKGLLAENTNILQKIPATAIGAPYGMNGIQFSSVLSLANGTNTYSFTYNHNFNGPPSAYIVTDLYSPSLAGGYITYSRVSSTDTQSTFDIRCVNSSGGTLTGNFSVLILR